MMTDKQMTTDNPDPRRLKVKQRIGLAGGVAFIVGSIIGSGIFISPRGALKYSGSVGLSLVVWTGCGGLATILALVYAEMGVRMPKSGGDYTYIRVIIGDLPAFLVAWLQTSILQPGSRAVLALVFADYLCAPIFGKCGPPNYLRKIIAAVEILSLAITNMISVRFATSMQGLFTCLKVLALVVISTGGFVYIFQGRTDNFNNTFEGSTTDVTNIALAIYQCMWAYGGYNNLNDIAEELIDPKKNIPRALAISMSLVTLVYITTNVSYFTVLTATEFLSVPAVAFSWGDIVLGSAAIIIPVSVMCSVHGASNGGFFADGRVRFAAARAGHLPELLSFLHHRTRIPTASLVFNTFCSLALLVPGDVSELINLVSFVSMFVSTMTVIALMKLKYTDAFQRKTRNCSLKQAAVTRFSLNSDDALRKEVPKEGSGETFSVPLLVPILALCLNLFMIVAPFISNPKIEFLYGIAYVASGIIFYIPFVWLKWTVPGFDSATMFTQLFLEICPTVLDKDLDVTVEVKASKP